MNNYISQTFEVKAFLKKEKYSLLFIFICFFFGGATSYWSLAVGFLLLLFLFLIRGDLRLYHVVNWNCILLMLALFFSVFISISNQISFLYALKFPLLMFCSYLIGRIYCDRYKSEEVFVFMLFFLALSLGLPHIIQTMKDIFEVGLVNPTRLLSTMDEAQRAITQRTTELSLCIAGFSLFFIPRKELKTPFLRIVFILIAFFATLCVLHYVSRTGVAFVVVTIAIGLLYRWRVSWKSVILIVLLIVFYRYMQGFELYDIFASRVTDTNNWRNAGLRSELWEWGLKYLWINPWGNVGMGEYKLDHYAHNFWIDYGISYSLIASLFMVLFSLNSVLFTINNLRKRIVTKNLSLVIVTFTIVIIMSLFTEPIIYGAVDYLMAYLLFCGMIESFFHK